MITCRVSIVPAALFAVLLTVALGCKTSPPSSPADSPPTVSITSPVQNEVSRLVDTVFINATDDKGVTKVELYINAAYAGTDSAAPWRFIWNTELWDDGDYVLQAKAYDNGGHSTTSANVTMTIRNAFPVTFINTTHTSMSITAYSVTRTVAVNDSTIYTLSTNPRSLVFTASTSGKTTGGTVIGVTLNWGGSGNPINVSSLTSARLYLQVPSTYFYMYMKNTGSQALGPIYVNYGLTDQTVDHISVPNGGATYNIGYYKAYTNTIVRAYWTSPSTSYSYWSSIPFPWTVNQAMLLSNSLGKAGIANAGEPEAYSGSVVVQPSVSRVPRQAGNSLVVPANE